MPYRYTTQENMSNHGQSFVKVFARNKLLVMIVNP